MPNKSKVWLSLHLYVTGGIYTGSCDQALCSVLPPFISLPQVRNHVSSFFFIRYGDEYGSHLRIRFCGDKGKLAHIIEPLFKEHVCDSFPDELGIQHSQPPKDNLEGVFPTLVRSVPYEPETNRYGGPEGVSLAESFFELSSRIALAYLPQICEGGNSVRLGKSLLLMIVLLQTFLSERVLVIRLLDQYKNSFLYNIATDKEREFLHNAFETGYDRQGDGLRVYVTETWNRLSSGSPLTDTLNMYRDELGPLRQTFDMYVKAGVLRRKDIFDNRIEAIHSILPSYLHMMNNRLGVSLYEEAYLSYLIRNTLQTEDDEVEKYSE